MFTGIGEDDIEMIDDTQHPQLTNGHDEQQWRDMIEVSIADTILLKNRSYVGDIVRRATLMDWIVAFLLLSYNLCALLYKCQLNYLVKISRYTLVLSYL